MRPGLRTERSAQSADRGCVVQLVWLRRNQRLFDLPSLDGIRTAPLPLIHSDDTDRRQSGCGIQVFLVAQPPPSVLPLPVSPTLTVPSGYGFAVGNSSSAQGPGQRTMERQMGTGPTGQRFARAVSYCSTDGT